MLLKHFPSLLRGNFLANQTGPDEFALWFHLRAIFLVSSCPLRPGRRLGACCPLIHASVLLCRWKSSGTWHPWQRAVDSRGITLLHWQRDINGQITNLWDARPMRLTHRDVSSASDVGVGLWLWPQSHTKTNELGSKQFSWLTSNPLGETMFGNGYLKICDMAESESVKGNQEGCCLENRRRQIPPAGVLI